jgi:hypothetical protein
MVARPKLVPEDDVFIAWGKRIRLPPEQIIFQLKTTLADLSGQHCQDLIFQALTGRAPVAKRGLNLDQQQLSTRVCCRVAIHAKLHHVV